MSTTSARLGDVIPTLARTVTTWRARRQVAPAALALLVGIVLVTAVLGGADLSFADTVSRIAIFVAIAQAWNVLAGFSGLISLGISAFVGSGAYATAMLVSRLGLPWWSALALVVPTMLVIGYLFSIPLLRLRSDYFAISSFAAMLLLQQIAGNVEFFGGAIGVPLRTSALPPPRVGAALAIGVGVVATLAVVYMTYSRFGLRVQAARDHERGAMSLGVRVKTNYLITFLISCVLAGLAGGVLALQDGTASPNSSFAMTWTISALLMATIGGVGTIVGPVTGVFLVYYLLQEQLEQFVAVALLVEGMVLITLIFLAPRGLWPLVKRLAGWLIRTVTAPRDRARAGAA